MTHLRKGNKKKSADARSGEYGGRVISVTWCWAKKLSYLSMKSWAVCIHNSFCSSDNECLMKREQALRLPKFWWMKALALSLLISISSNILRKHSRWLFKNVSRICTIFRSSHLLRVDLNVVRHPRFPFLSFSKTFKPVVQTFFFSLRLPQLDQHWGNFSQFVSKLDVCPLLHLI